MRENIFKLMWIILNKKNYNMIVYDLKGSKVLEKSISGQYENININLITVYIYIYILVFRVNMKI